MCWVYERAENMRNRKLSQMAALWCSLSCPSGSWRTRYFYLFVESHFNFPLSSFALGFRLFHWSSYINANIYIFKLYVYYTLWVIPIFHIVLRDPYIVSYRLVSSSRPCVQCIFIHSSLQIFPFFQHLWTNTSFRWRLRFWKNSATGTLSRSLPFVPPPPRITLSLSSWRRVTCWTSFAVSHCSEWLPQSDNATKTF